MSFGSKGEESKASEEWPSKVASLVSALPEDSRKECLERLVKAIDAKAKPKPNEKDKAIVFPKAAEGFLKDLGFLPEETEWRRFVKDSTTQAKQAPEECLESLKKKIKSMETPAAAAAPAAVSKLGNAGSPFGKNGNSRRWARMGGPLTPAGLAWVWVDT